MNTSTKRGPGRPALERTVNVRVPESLWHWIQELAERKQRAARHQLARVLEWAKERGYE